MEMNHVHTKKKIKINLIQHFSIRITRICSLTGPFPNVPISVDEEAGEGAVRPVRVKEQAVLPRVEDLQPHLVVPPQLQHGGARRHVVVPRVGVERLDLVVPVVEQPDGQVPVGQGDVVGEVVHAGDGADELPAGGVVVVPLVEQDAPEADGQPLLGVALGHRHGEGRARLVVPAATAPGGPVLARIARLALPPRFARHPRGPPQPAQAPGPGLADHTFFALRPRLPRIPWPPGLS